MNLDWACMPWSLGTSLVLTTWSAIPATSVCTTGSSAKKPNGNTSLVRTTLTTDNKSWCISRPSYGTLLSPGRQNTSRWLDCNANKRGGWQLEKIRHRQQVRSGNGVVRLASLVQTRSLVPKYCGERTMIFLENPIIINNRIHDVIISQNFRPRLCLWRLKSAGCFQSAPAGVHNEFF